MIEFMKNIFFSTICAVALCLPMLSACDTDRDDNPVLYEPSSFVLETPQEQIYDLSKKETVFKLQCQQPEYGFQAAVTYTLHISLTENGLTEEGQFTTLGTTFVSTTIQPDVNELNNALADLYMAANPDVEDVAGKEVVAYMKLDAILTGSSRGVSSSNAVEVKTFKLGTPVVTLEPPTEMYIVGSSIGTPWTTWQKMIKVNGMDGEFWTMVYIDAENGQFKFGKYEQDWLGFDNISSFNDQAGANPSNEGGNIKVKAGWYVIAIRAEVKGSEYAYTMSFYLPQIYLFGAANGGVWAYADEWKFTIPETPDGEFVSPAFAASGELRMCVKAEYDWYRYEFTLKDGATIFYREDNAVNNGWTDLGSEYSVVGNPGQKVYLNFSTGTGEVK